TYKYDSVWNGYSSSVTLSGAPNYSYRYTRANSVTYSTALQKGATAANCDSRYVPFPTNGVQVGLLDGSVRGVSGSVSAATWRHALNPSDGAPLGSDW